MSESTRGGWLLPAGALLVALLAAFFLRPDEAAHKAAIRAHCGDQAGALGDLGCGAALGMGGLVGAVELQDYVLVTRLMVAGKPVSTGAFGYVHVW